MSFGLLFQRHHRHVVAWACRISGDFDLALDLAQDVFVKVLTHVHAFRSDARFTTWLYTVTRNCYRDHLKARAARPREVGGEALEAVEPFALNAALDRLDALQTRGLISRLVSDARLDPTEKRVLVMHYRDDMPLAAITAGLALKNASGAKGPIVSATRKLRAAAARWTRRQQVRLRADAA